jgi:hypothetical protein
LLEKDTVKLSQTVSTHILYHVVALLDPNPTFLPFIGSQVYVNVKSSHWKYEDDKIAEAKRVQIENVEALKSIVVIEEREKQKSSLLAILR